MRDTVTLKGGIMMPLLGLGVYQLGEETESTVSYAIREGYRLIDTAPVYRNEEAVGKAIASCKIPRKDLFITSKVWNNAQRMGDTRGSLERSLERLGLSYVDLYLIHWPVPGCYPGTWEVMEELLSEDLCRSIGVCNFSIENLEELKRVSGITPSVNQIEIHPLCFPRRLVEYCRKEGIVVQASAPLARGAYLDNDFLCVLATKYALTPAQIGLIYLVQQGISVIPRSHNPQHLKVDADIFGIPLEEEDMRILDSLNESLHTVDIPEDLASSISYTLYT